MLLFAGDNGHEKDEVAYNNYKQLEQSGKTVTAIISEDLDLDMHKFNLRVVGIEGEEGNGFSVESHNRRQRADRIIFSFSPALVIIIKFISQIKIAYREIIIPTRKRRKRKKRELERQRLLEEHTEGIPPKQSKELSRAKSKKRGKR